MWDWGIIGTVGLHPLFELASVAALIALSMRNQISLRLILLLVYALRVADDCSGPGGPLWEHASWNLLFFALNAYVLAELIYGRTTVWFTDDEKRLFGRFSSLAPGDFRKLIAPVSWRSADVATTLTTEGVRPDKLFLVFEGLATVSKGGREVTLEPLTFIGEVAFLRGGPASASVTVAPGTRWVEWSVPRLNRLLDRNAALRTCFTRLIGEDLAQKVARA